MTSRLLRFMLLGTGLALALAGITAGPRTAAAKPEYAAQVKKPCGFCHQNPSGGGPLNGAGKKFLDNGHKL